MKKSMRNIINCTIIIISTLALFATTAFADDFTKTINIYKKSPGVKPFFSNSYGYVVFPTVGKGGLGVGGAYGKGQVYKGGKPTGKASLSKISVGFQAGGQAFSEMIFFKDKRAYDEFTSGEFAFDAAASAVAITYGAQAKAGTDGTGAGASTSHGTGGNQAAKYNKGMAIFTLAKGGLMYEAAIGGQKFNFKKY